MGFWVSVFTFREQAPSNTTITQNTLMDPIQAGFARCILRSFGFNVTSLEQNYCQSFRLIGEAGQAIMTGQMLQKPNKHACLIALDELRPKT